MPPAQVLLLEVSEEGYAQVYRYTLDGEFAGDTWHETREAADGQVAYEYGDAVGPWSAVPAEVEDAHVYAVSWAREHDREA